MTLFTLGLIGCGRIGYDAVGDDVAPIDAEVDAEPGVEARCNLPVDLLELPVGAQTVSALELGATQTGFIAVYAVDDAVWSSGFSVSASQRWDTIQTGGVVFNDYTTDHLALASNGDRAVLAADNPGANAIYFYPLAETGYQRGATKSHDGVHAHGQDFIVADPTELVFGVAAGDGTNLVAIEREIDSHPNVDAITAIAGIVPDTTGVARLGDGYVVMSGRDAQCDVIAVDDLLMPVGTAQTISMTCHNAQIVNSNGDHVVAAWNCNDDQVWITGGSLGAGLPPHRSLYGTDGDTANSASDPRLAVSNAGVWYGFRVAGGRLGRALVDIDGANIATVTPDVVVPGNAGAYDLAARDGEAYLFWTETSAATTHLWAMRLCQ